MTPTIDLRPDHRKIVKDILREHLPRGVKVWVFGSRAEWTTKDSSDLDLALDGDEPLDSRTVMALELAFEESLLPFSVDVVDLHRVDEAFREIMLRTRVLLLSRASGESARARGPWDNKPLRELADVRLSSVDKKTVDGEIRVRLCNYTDVYYNQLIHTQLPFMEATATENEIRKCALHPDDVVITKDSEKHDDIGVPALVKGSIDSLVCGYHLAILRPEEGTHGPYLFYALSARPVQQQFHGYANGVTRFGLRKSDIGRVDVPTPPPSDQRAIARVLGALDDRIELNLRMNTTLEAMARALFKSWFVDFDPVRAKMEGRDPGIPSEIADLFPDRLVESELGDVPEDWDVVPLDTIAVFRNGLALQKFRPKADEAWLPVLKIAQLRRGSTDAVERARASIASDFIVDDGDIVFSWSGSLELRIWTGGKAALNQHLFKVTSSSYPRWFVFRSVESHLRAFRAIAAGKATTMGHIKREHLHEALCVVPHRHLLKAVSCVFERLEELKIRQSVASRELHALRDTLLPKLVCGDVRLPAALVSEAA
jgi:type I restriction enzyme S subunit